MNYDNRKMHEVFRGTKNGLEGERRYPAGHALRFDGTSYFVLKLWFQPDRTYYVAVNGAGGGAYTIYSRKSESQIQTASFQNPIGYARNTDDKQYLELVLPDLPKRYYLSLFPAA